MLTGRKAPRACQSCRLQLLSLFEHGFAKPGTISAARRPYSNPTILRPGTLKYARHSSIGRFSTSKLRAEEAQKDTHTLGGAPAEDIESVVRQARQTFGETLPKDYLSAEEYILYERLYGPPIRDTKAEDLEYLPEVEEEDEQGDVRNVLLRENDDGEFEEIEFDPELGFSIVEDGSEGAITGEKEPDAVIEGLSEIAMEMEDPETNNEDGSQEQTVDVQAKNRREIDAIARLQRDMDASTARPVEEEEDIDEEFEEEEEEMEEEEEYDEDESDEYLSSDSARTHPHTMAGRSGTSPSTLVLPQEQLVQPITELLARTNMKHLAEAAEKAFGGKGLPNSSSTPASKKLLPQKHIGLDAAQHKMSEVEADAYLAAVMPGTYASTMNRGGEGPRVLDAGGGGVGIIAWREILQAEWDVLREEGIVEGQHAPSGKNTVLTGSSAMRHRVSRFLDNTTFLPRLPDYIHAANSDELLNGGPAQGRKSYDLIIAPHTLFPLKENFRRKNMVQNLWSLLDPNGGVLILIEKGVPRGFEAIAGARSLLLDSHISSPGATTIENEIQSPSSDSTRFTKKEDGMIIAPCTSHKSCPMYPIPGLSTGRKDFCHFGQRFIRPPFLQKVLGASLRNHEDVKYSYIAVRRGVDLRKGNNPILQGDAATELSFTGYEEVDLPESETDADAEAAQIKFNALSLPRAILPPLKRRGHVTLDLCTPSGKLERWTVPKSFSKAAYRDARKSKWGDLWALGGKTRTLRSPRLGRLSDEGQGRTGLKGVRDGRMGKSGKKVKKNKFDIIMGNDGFEGIQHDRSQAKFVRPQKRTKGGRIWKEEKPIGEDDL